MGWDGGGGGDGFQRYGPNIMKRPAFFQSEALAVFSFLYLKKIKISKIYVRIGKFQKYIPVALS